VSAEYGLDSSLLSLAPVAHHYEHASSASCKDPEEIANLSDVFGRQLCEHLPVLDLQYENFLIKHNYCRAIFHGGGYLPASGKRASLCKPYCFPWISLRRCFGVDTSVQSYQ